MCCPKNDAAAIGDDARVYSISVEFFVILYLLNVSAGVVDRDDVLRRRRYQHSDTGYASQCETRLHHDDQTQTQSSSCITQQPYSSSHRLSSNPTAVEEQGDLIYQRVDPRCGSQCNEQCIALNASNSVSASSNSN